MCCAAHLLSSRKGSSGSLAASREMLSGLGRSFPRRGRVVPKYARRLSFVRAMNSSLQKGGTGLCMACYGPFMPQSGRWAFLCQRQDGSLHWEKGQGFMEYREVPVAFTRTLASSGHGHGELSAGY